MKLTNGSINSYYNDVSILSFLKQNLPNLKGKVLDIGCGKMRYKKTILSGSDVTNYIGLDLKEGEFCYSVPADLYWDGQKIPLEDNSIDSAILFEVVEHCPDPMVVIKEAYRILKPGGIILFSTPFTYQLHGAPYDYQRLTPFGAEKLFLTVGFINIEIRSSGSWDASLGQMISGWISHRPMPMIMRKFLSYIFVLFFKILIWSDKKLEHGPLFKNNDMISGIIGIAYKK